MTTGLSLENLAKILHTDKQRAFAEECFARQVEMAQNPAPAASSSLLWGKRSKRLSVGHIVVKLAVHPLRLTVQWV
jgi:hypothetical protein